MEAATEAEPQDVAPGTTSTVAAQPPAEPAQADAVAELLRKAAVGQMMKRLDPTFNPLDHSHESYRAMLKAYEHLLEVRDGEHDQMVRLR